MFYAERKRLEFLIRDLLQFQHGSRLEVKLHTKMKIDRNKLKKSSTDVPADCRALIERLKNASGDTLLTELIALKNSTFVKCELFHWADVLDIFDDVLEKACKKETEKSWTLACDLPENAQLKTLLLQVLNFTSTLIEHSFSRHMYNSMEHLTTLLASCDMTVVLEVLNLLYVFSKRSNFITRLGSDKKQGLIVHLTHLAESWGGKDNGFGLAECCQDNPISSFPGSATTLHFEFYHENPEEKNSRKGTSNIITSIHIENVDQYDQLPSQIMEELVSKYRIPENKQTLLYTHIRLAHLFTKYECRVQCVQARLQSIAILVYSNAMQENINSLLYPGFIEELVDIVELKKENLVEIKSAALRTLTSIIHLERNPKLTNIIDATGAGSYHGFLPVLVRNCIQHMTDAELKAFPQPYATALFSFLYHLASYENGVEALVSCGMMESLLKVINWYGEGHDHITFATRAVRVVDLITNLDMAAFQTQGGLTAFINRLEHEVGICRQVQSFEIRPRHLDTTMELQPESPPLAMETDAASPEHHSDTPTMEDQGSSVDEPQPSTSTGITGGSSQTTLPDYSAAKTGRQCFPQRAALLKSMLNFLKKAIPDPSFSESMRHLMEGSLPKSLKHIISNAEYYGPSLFLLATDVVTVYVFQEPSLLSSLQDNGLTDVVLHALLIKDVPATREVLASLPNVFSALCLNARGLESFVQCQPFERLFKVLLSPDYLPAMRRRRSADPFASNLGNAMDELMRHQPSLRIDATKAIIRLLQEVNSLGRDNMYVCQKPQPKTEQMLFNLRSPQAQDGGSSDEEDEEEEMAAAGSSQTPPVVEVAESKSTEQSSSSAADSTDKQAIPLMDYVLNVMKFVEAILSNNSTDDHCREFVGQNGLPELMDILGMPNLPIEFPASPACQAVASVCKAILTLLRDPKVLEEGLKKLNTVLEGLEPLHQPLDGPGGSVLLRELASVAHIPDATLSPTATPLLHALSSAHAYITMFVHVCKMGQTDIRTISVNHWGSELGLKVLSGLSKLYTSLVWESTVLLALCSEDILPANSEFGRADMSKLLPKDFKADADSKDEETAMSRASVSPGSNGVSQAMESLSTSDTPITMDTEETTPSDKDSKKSKLSPALQAQVKQLKPLLTVSSRLGRALAELFGLLVKLSVGGRLRQRGNQLPPTMPIVPSPAAQSVAKALTKLLTDGLKWEPPAYSPHPKLRLTFLVCSVGFTSPMLFDDKKQPYHLMLQKFLSCGGQDALFQAFNWALSTNGQVSLNEGLENPDLPVGTGEFLDAWLMLIEKMVNPKTVLESTHQLPAKSSQPGFIPFDPIQYLIGIQKAAFNAVMNLWNKKPLKMYGGRMSESILAIMCHIIKAEAVITEHMAKVKPASSDGATASTSGTSATGLGTGIVGQPVPATGTSSATAAASRPVNDAHVDALMEMGFSRNRCIDALWHTQTLEEATEYLLTSDSAGRFSPPPVANLTGIDMNEDEQMLQAIALSLRQDTEGDGKVEEEGKKKEEEEKQDSQEPLDKSVLDNFTGNLFPGCLTLLDTLPETVYRVCELLIVVTQRNGQEWQNMVLNTLVEEVKTLAKSILSLSSPSDFSNKMAETEAAKFAVRIHLFSLLFEETMMPCAEAVENNNLTDLLVQVMMAGKDYLMAVKSVSTPKWLAPLLLLLDLYEKVSVISKRKAEAEKTLVDCHTWKWFDDTSGRWCKYSAGNNKTIDDAYQAGESSVKFTAGRRRYTVYFSSMVQVNEDTANRRPIMLTCPSPTEVKQSNERKEENTTENQTAESKMDTDSETPSTSAQKKDAVVVNGLSSKQISNIISSIVSMIGVPVEAETLHAALRLILRLTREHKYALQFAELGGPKLLLGLTQASAFQGFLSLVTLIFRHILEEPSSLRYCMEKVIKSTCSGAGSSLSGVSQRSVGAKEMHYVLRVLGPAACRNSALFSELARQCMRIALPPPSKRDEDESRFTGPNAPQILKCVSSDQLATTTIESPMKDVIESLLDALIVKYPWNTEDGKSSDTGGKNTQSLAEVIAEVVNELSDRQSEITRQNSTAEMLHTEDDAQTAGEGAAESAKTKDGSSAEEKQAQRPLLTKSSILRMLSEIIKSYCNCTQHITQHMYHSGQTELVQEDSTVLGFVLDHLLHPTGNAGDADCPALSRVFIASIASCNHSPEAQLTLVSEVKSALQRALTLPESSDKHSRVQALTGIISTMIESCPTQGQIPNQVFKGQQNIMNSIVRNLLKRGLVTDLARIPYSLDLSSPYMAATINAALKPLETLTRSVNMNSQNVSAKQKLKSVTDTADNPEVNTTTPNTQEVAEATSAETGDTSEVQIEEVLNTQAEDLEETHQDSVIEPAGNEPSELDDVLDDLLERDRNANPESQVMGEIIMDTDQNQEPDVLVDVDIEEGEIDDHHDSQMISQILSEADLDINDTTNMADHIDDAEETADSASDPDDDDNDGDDDDDDEDEDDDDDHDDDDNEDEDDEGSDMEADNFDFQPESASFGRPFNDHFVIHADEMFGGSNPQHVVFNALDNGHVRTYQMPLSLHDNDNNGNETAAPSLPPAPSNVTSIHPLLVRQSEADSTRLQRLQRRQRGMCRYNPLSQTLHVNFPRPPNPPVILQRLLGPQTAADVLQLTNSMNTTAGPAHTRVVLSNNDLRIISRQEEDILEELFQDSYPPDSGGGMGVGTLSSVPNTLTRWTEEAKVLDGDSIHDCMAAIKPEIIEVLEKKRDEELGERREKRKKAAEEEAAKKAEEQAKKNTEQKMDVSPATTSIQAPVSTGVLDVSNIPLPGEVTSVSTGTTATSSQSGQISASEAAAAAEVIAEQMVEEALAVSTAVTTTNVPTGFQAMPPLSTPLNSSTPDVVATNQTNLLQRFGNQQNVQSTPMPVPQPTALQFTTTPMSVPPPSVASIFAPPTMPVPSPSFPEQVPLSASTPLPISVGLTPSSNAATRMQDPFANLAMPQLTPLMPSGLGAPISTSGSFSNVPTAALYTPANQNIPLVTPMAPRLDRFGTGQQATGNNLTDIFQSYLRSSVFPQTPLTTSEGGTGSSNLPMSHLASLLLTADADETPEAGSGPRSAATGGAPPRADIESGVITPEEISNITSSDAATVHSSASGSPQEITADRLLANLTSITDGATPVSTVASSQPSQAVPQSSQAVAGSSGGEATTSGGVPEGLDPSFLAALPENIRAEVIADHLRMQRIQARTREQQQNQTPGGMEVNPEFLAALPPNIQEEVLAQQRIEQERLAAQTNPPANPETPVDPASFFATLPSTLRQSVLADMDDSMMAVLPADLAAEAQTLRRELEDRHRRIMQERLFTQPGSGGSLSSILRHAGTIRCTLGRGPRSGQNWIFGDRGGRDNMAFANTLKLRGRHLLDHEALTCLLVLLFVDEPKLNTGRLHRVLRNLCYHGPTRIWVLRAMLSILTRTAESRVDIEERMRTPEKGKGKKSQSQSPMLTEGPGSSKMESRSQGPWLSISLEAALGCRANVFQIHRALGKKHSSSGNTLVTIHPQAAPIVCRHVLDALISLAKMFPNQFLPSKAKEVQKCDNDKEKESDKTKTSVTTGTGATPKVKTIEKQDSKSENRDTDFWELLVKLDSLCSSKKGKGIQRTHSNVNSDQDPGFKDFDSSPLGQLMSMLSHPVIKRSQLLTDRLLRLLGLVSGGLSENERSTGAGTSSQSRAIEVMPSIITRQENTAAVVPPQPTSQAPGTAASTDTASGTGTESTPSADSKDKEKSEQPVEQKKEPEKPVEESAILESQLSMAVQVLTSKSCSEEGLEDATNLLLQLSFANTPTRQSVLKLLLAGARELGLTVCSHIRILLDDLHSLNQKLSPDGEPDEGKEMETSTTSTGRGVLHDRYTGQAVVVTAPKKMKSGRELQVPSMTALTSKSSSQHFFLRILKVIIQLRDAARTANKKKLGTGTGSSNRDFRHLGEAMALLEAEADAIMQFVNNRREGTAAPAPAVEINIRDTDNNTPDTPHVPPPVHGSVGLASQQGTSQEGEVVAQGAPTTAEASGGEQTGETPMETDKPGTSTEMEAPKAEVQLPRLSEQIDLEELWFTLGECLTELDKTPDHHAVLILQPAVEAFFLVHAGEKENKVKDNKPVKREDQLAHLNMDMPPSPQPAPSSDVPPLNRENSLQTSVSNLPPDTQKFLKFAETHRTVLNQILRQSTTPLADGPFSVLVDHTRILDFDVKRRYFRQELERLDEGIRREDLAVHVRREHVFEDSFRELFRKTADEWKHRFYIVFEGEDGQDAGGLLREWYIIIAREIFNPMYALFCTSPGDRVTYTINASSHCNSNHLSYFKFVGRIIAKAIYDNKLMECYFTRSFYKHIIGAAVKYVDMETEDYSFYQGLVFLLENNVKDLGYDLTFSTEIMEFGINQVRDLIPNGRNINVTEETKYEYVKHVCQMKMTGAIRQQLSAFLEGFYDIVPKKLIAIFNEQELELLLSGLPTIDIEDLKANSEYHKYQSTSLQIQWFWRALRSFDQADRARFLQFVTGTSKVPLQGFAHLEGMNGTQKFQIHRDDRSTDRLPAAHTCFNQLDLPAYETYDKLRHMLLLAINECSEGFGLA
ncbi:E3 ubiquitin-protein ligase HUWE1-like isoform X3 [Mercenaria mercenaria]|uniref:E3 ubiquitin-protein ligase HUWE1-like isoform X3 n=1 Tax=Mercenaria mercenaria TaxID=6596 RepID=UPI00234E69C6|nr:E3 ubiquitin-protein ligase HUWE1-like isoform X3 [Mercenaria mercenaria]